jgi:hypothetical protein
MALDAREEAAQPLPALSLLGSAVSGVRPHYADMLNLVLKLSE